MLSSLLEGLQQSMKQVRIEGNVQTLPCKEQVHNPLMDNKLVVPDFTYHSAYAPKVTTAIYTVLLQMHLAVSDVSNMYFQKCDQVMKLAETVGESKPTTG